MDRLIALRDFSDGDLPLFKRWLGRPHVAAWYHQPEDWIGEVEKRAGEFCWLHHFIAEHGGRPVGFCQYYEYARSGESWHGGMDVEGVYSIDYLIGEAPCLGKGLGRAIVMELIGKLRGVEGARRVIVQPEPENRASCNTLRSCGFRFDEEKELYLLDL